MLDYGNFLVEFGERSVAELVDLGEVWLGVGVWGLEVGQGELDEGGIAVVGEVDSLGAVWVVLDSIYRVRDDGIGGEMLKQEVSTTRRELEGGSLTLTKEDSGISPLTVASPIVVVVVD